MTFDERRAAEERQFHRDIIQGMLASEQEIPADLWAKGYGSEEAGRAATGTAGEAGVAGEQGEDGEFQALTNEAGDFFLGDDGLGTSGERQADPWDQEGEFYQWYARGTYLDRTYYRIDEDGNEIFFTPGQDGARWPGDVSLRHRNSSRTRIDPDGMLYDAFIDHPDVRHRDQEGGIYQHPDSSYSTDKTTLVNFLDKIAQVLDPSHDHADLFGEGIGNEWRVAKSGSTKKHYYRAGNGAIMAFIELGQYISLFKQQNDGQAPNDEEMYDHLSQAGVLPIEFVSALEGRNPWGAGD